MGLFQRRESEITAQSTADDVGAILRPGNATFNTGDPERLCEFWAAVTGYEPRPPSGSRLGLRDPSGRGPSLTFQRSDTADPLPGRCHVDFYADDPDDVAERALQLGAEFGAPSERR